MDGMSFLETMGKAICVTIRWFGSSSGYYSESADWERVDKCEPDPLTFREMAIKAHENQYPSIDKIAKIKKALTDFGITSGYTISDFGDVCFDSEDITLFTWEDSDGIINWGLRMPCPDCGEICSSRYIAYSLAQVGGLIRNFTPSTSHIIDCHQIASAESAPKRRTSFKTKVLIKLKHLIGADDKQEFIDRWCD